MTQASASNNYFVVPQARRHKSRLVEILTDPNVGKIAAIGEAAFRAVGRFDVSSRIKTWRTTGQRSIIPIASGTFYFRGQQETVAGEVSRGPEVVLRLEKVKDGDRIPLNWEVVERDSEEWISIKVAKILETPSKPSDVDWARYFFFDDKDPASALRAFDAARTISSQVAAFRPVTLPGPWSAAKLVGDSGPGAN